MIGKMKIAAVAAMAAAVAIVAGFPALADTVAPAASNTVSIPWGPWIAAILGNITVPGVLTWATWLATRLGVPWIQNFLINDAVQRAIGSGLATVQGAVATAGPLEIGVANNVARAAIVYLVNHEPMIVGWLGDALAPRIVAQLGSMGLAPSDAVIATQAK